MNRMGIFLGLQKLKILLGVLEFPDLFWGGVGKGVKNDGPKPAYKETMKVSPPLCYLTTKWS